MPLLLFLSSLWLYPLPSVAATFSGKVVSVSEGALVTVMQNGARRQVRLNGIECPQEGQAFADEATQFTLRVALGKPVKVRTYGRNRYGHVLGDVTLPDGRVLNQELVRAGLAWWHAEYSTDQRLADLQAKARLLRLGLWHDPQPVPPWEFRARAQADASSTPLPNQSNVYDRPPLPDPSRKDGFWSWLSPTNALPLNAIPLGPELFSFATLLVGGTLILYLIRRK